MNRSNIGLVRRTALVLACCLSLVGSAPGAQGDGAIAFVGVSVIPMDTERVLTRHTVIVQGDRIVAIEPADEASLPPGTRRIEAQGRYLIPGLVDVHARVLSDLHIAHEFIDDELAVMVANGVTTWRSPVGTARLLDDRERIASTDVVAPTLYVASPLLTNAGTEDAADRRVLRTPFEAAAAIRGFDSAGYDFVSLGFDLSSDMYQGIVLTARGSGMPVIGHVPATVGLRRALEAGQEIAHLDGYLKAMMDDAGSTAGLSGGGVWRQENWAALDRINEERIEDLVRATVDAEVWNTPTLSYLDVAFGTGRTDADIEQSPEYRFVSPTVRAALLAPRDRFWSSPPDVRLRRRYVELRSRLVRELHQAGGKLLLGSGAPEWMLLYGFGAHRELGAMVAAGLPPFSALSSATRSPAVFLSWGGGGGRTEYATVEEGTIRFESAVTGEVDFGTIAVGKRADLVLLGSNPLDDINNTQAIEGVVLRGRWLPREELDELLGGAAARLSRARRSTGS